MSQKHHSTRSWTDDPSRVLAHRLKNLKIGDDCRIPDSFGGGIVWRKESHTYRVYRYGAIFARQFVPKDGDDGSNGPLWQQVHGWLVRTPARLDEVG